MGLIKKAKNLLRLGCDPEFRFNFFWSRGYYDRMHDDRFLKKLFWIKLHEKLDLNDPQTYNEKLQWLKLHDYQPAYQDMADKYEAKKYVAQRIGGEYIIPTLGIWERFEDIDFDTLPDQFVLKCTHDSGGLVICKDKSKLDLEAARQKIQASQKRNWFYHGREYPYKDIPPRIIAEQYMVDSENDADNLTDYKFFCFDGVPRYVMTVRDRGLGVNRSLHRWYDMEWNLQDLDLDHRGEAKEAEPKPAQFEKMREVAAALSGGLKHVRVDLYVVEGRIYFGELTFYHKSGLEIFEPKEWDLKLGSYIKLD